MQNEIRPPMAIPVSPPPTDEALSQLAMSVPIYAHPTRKLTAKRGGSDDYAFRGFMFSLGASPVVIVAIVAANFISTEVTVWQMRKVMKDLPKDVTEMVAEFEKTFSGKTSPKK